MRFEDVKETLQSSIDDDLDALYGAFVQESGPDDVAGFVRLLFDGQLIDQATFDGLISGTLATAASAVQGPADDLDARQAELETKKVAGPKGLKATYQAVLGKKPGKLRRDELIIAILEAEFSGEPPANDEPANDEPANDQRAAPPAPPTEPEDVDDLPTAQPVDASAPEPMADTSEPEAPEAMPAEDKAAGSGAPKAPTPVDEPQDSGAALLAENADRDNPDNVKVEEDAESPSGTYILGQDGENTNPKPEEPRKRRREGNRTGARTGQRRKMRDTDGSDTGARRRNAKDRQLRKQQAGGGAAVAGKGYDFIGELGQGAMGAVLKAKDLDLNRVVAFKTMSAEIAASPLASKFISEAQITAQLEHPNIIPVYGLESTDQGNLAYAMKMVRGKTFEDIILECREFWDKKQPMDEEHTLTTRLEQFLLVCEAIHYAHRRGVVHRDLKPENLMIGAYGEVYVMDWGISSIFSDKVEDPKEDPVTLSTIPDEDGEMIIGTPQYMSPEQAHGLNLELDGHSDQYALGLILYELICLQQAVTGKAPLKIVMRQQDGEKNPLVHYKKGTKIPPPLMAIALKACAKDKPNRYTTVGELAADLQQYMRGEATIAKPDTTIQKFFRFLNRHKEATAFLVMSSFMALFVVIIMLMGYNAYATAQAHAREERVATILTSVASQSAKIDGTFVHYEGLLGVAKATASDMLISGDIADKKIYWGADYDNEEAAPPNTFKAEHYGGMSINIDYPAYFLAKGVAKTDVTVAMNRLEPLRRHHKTILLRSKSEKEANAVNKRAKRLIGDLGVPLAWVHVGLENGLYVGYPGHGGYPAQWDPRQRPWYKLAKNKKVPTWGAPYPDYFELGAILPCAAGIYDSDGSFVGTVAVELTFDYIIEKLLSIDDLFTEKKSNDTRTEFFLVDDEGRIVVRSSKRDVKVRGGHITPRPLRLVELPYADVRERMDKRQSGYLEVGDELVFFNRLNSLGWYYVVAGQTDVLLDVGAR